jgi:WD40 repeat protein
MAIAEAHPSAEELAAFTLGTLDDEAQASIEAHVAACTSCQERAAVAPGDSLVELLRRLDAGMSRGAETFMEPAAQVQTPLPPSAVALTDAILPAVALSAPAESDCPELPDAVPPELAHHERYRIVRLLGVGGMGAVYEAEHLVLHRPVALKVIKRAYTASPDALERFRREVRTAARLSHPNIVTTHDAEDAGETHFLVMEYVDGTDLGRLVQERGLLPVAETCEYIRQAALGLQHAFEQGMVHRDLKPHNLMLTLDGRVKILDFGLARFASEAADAAGLTSTGIVLGTVDYIAPEQAESAHQADIRSDIYSLGCTLYHLLAGQPPLQKVMAHVNKKPQPLTELRPDLPEELMLVLERMMAKNPKHRYQTPAEVAIALEPFTRAIAIALPPKPPRPEPEPNTDHTIVFKKPVWDRWRPRLMIATAVLAFLVAGLLGVGVYRIATDKGELVIQTDNDDVEVVVSKGGKEVKIIDTKTGKHVTLDSGEYELALKDGGDLTISPGKITLKRGKTVLATITRRKPDGPLADLPPAGRPPDGVVAWWRADGDAKDSAGKNHGTLKGGVTFATGVAGKAFRLDGATRYVEVPRSDLWGFGSRDFSIELWVQFRGVTPSHDIGLPSAVFIGCDEGNSTPQGGNKWFFAYGGGCLNFHICRADRGGGFYAKADFSPDLDQWYHLAVTRSRGTITIYMNGAPVSSEKVDIVIPNPNAPLIIGQAENLGFFSGLIDEVAIYDRALSPEEVKARWSALAPATKPVAEKVGLVRRFLGHKGSVRCVAYSRDGRYAVSGGGWPNGDRTIRLWDVSTGKQIRQFDSPDGEVGSVAFSPDGRRILYGTQENTAFLLDVATGKEVSRFAGGVRWKQVQDATFSPDGRKILLASEDGTVRVWGADIGKELCKFQGHRDRVIGAVFSPDGKRAVSGALDNTIYLWDVETGEKVQSFEGNKGGVHSVAISPDGRYLLSGSWDDNSLRLWEVATGKLVREFIGHESGVPRVAFSHDGCRAISGSRDKTVRLWDVATGKQLHCFTGHTDTVWGVAFSPDDRYALSASQDQTLRLWRLPDPPPAKEKP